MDYAVAAICSDVLRQVVINSECVIWYVTYTILHKLNSTVHVYKEFDAVYFSIMIMLLWYLFIEWFCKLEKHSSFEWKVFFIGEKV